MMKRAVVNLADSSFINIPADRMEKDGEMIFVYNGSSLVAAIDLSCILSVHIVEKRAGE